MIVLVLNSSFFRQTHTSPESESECTQSSQLDEPGDNTDW